MAENIKTSILRNRCFWSSISFTNVNGFRSKFDTTEHWCLLDPQTRFRHPLMRIVPSVLRRWLANDGFLNFKELWLSAFTAATDHLADASKLDRTEFWSALFQKTALGHPRLRTEVLYQRTWQKISQPQFYGIAVFGPPYLLQMLTDFRQNLIRPSIGACLIHKHVSAIL
jgi:hypothetical protein